MDGRIKVPKFLNIKQLCRAAGISRRTVYNHVKAGLLPRPVKKGGSSMWETKEVGRALAKRRRQLVLEAA